MTVKQWPGGARIEQEDTARLLWQLAPRANSGDVHSPNSTATNVYGCYEGNGHRRQEGFTAALASALDLIAHRCGGEVEFDASSDQKLLGPGWDLQSTDVAPLADSLLDVTDFDDCLAAFIGLDTVVHLAAVPDPDASWAHLLPANVIGARQVAQAGDRPTSGGGAEPESGYLYDC